MPNQQLNSLAPIPESYKPDRVGNAVIRLLRTSNDISTPEKLAALISDGNRLRYKDAEEDQRRVWIGLNIFALCRILHFQPPTAEDVELDSLLLDQMIMDNGKLSCLKREEMEEAFRRGIAKEYGEFYGITATSLVGFLRAYCRSEKRQAADAIIRAAEKEKEREGDKRFWKALLDREKIDGDFIPTWGPEKNFKKSEK